MSYSRTYMLILAAAINLPMVLPNSAHATSGSRPHSSRTSAAIGHRAPQADADTESQAISDPDWTATPLDEAQGFTDAASAYEPDPVEQTGTDSQAQAATTKSPDSASHRSKIPEPSTLMLFGSVLIGIGYAARKRTKS